MSTLETELDEEKKSSLVVDYLQGPRKKRKNYILSVFGKSFDPDVSSAVHGWVKKNFPNLAFTSPRNVKELTRMFSRQINLLMADDEFCDRETLLNQIKIMKSKKQNQGSPVLFFTNDVKSLIESYHKILLPYQEIDNYVSYRSMPMNQIYSRIQAAINIKATRKSRRFEINIPVRYFHLSKDRYLSGHIVEISVHGGMIHSEEDLIFKTYDQLKIHIPVKGLLPPEHGEFIRVPAKVRRVMMGGNKAAISWEYLSETQHLTLTSFVLEYVNSKMIRIQNKSG